MDPELPPTPQQPYDPQSTWQAPEPQQQDSPEPPIEDPNFGDSAIAAMVLTAKRLLTTPSRFFSGMQEERSATAAVVWALSIMCLSRLLYLIITTLIFPQPNYAEMMQQFFDQMGIDPGNMDSLGPLFDPSSPSLFLVSVIMIPIQAIIGFFISVLIYYLSAYIWKAFEPRFSMFIRIYAFAQTPALIAWFPLIGGLTSVIWSLILLGMGLVYAGKATQGRAVGAVVTPIVFCCVCLACFLMFFVFAIAGAAANG